VKFDGQLMVSLVSSVHYVQRWSVSTARPHLMVALWCLFIATCRHS